MKNYRKILAAAMALSMMLPLSSCGDTDKSSSQTEQSESASSAADTLKKVYDELLKNESYTEYKGYYPNTTFGEKLENDSIVITAKGMDGVEGTFRFPLKDGYLTAELTSGDYTSPMLFSTLTGCVGRVYDIDSTLFTGWINGMGTLGIASKYYKTDQKADGSGTMQIYIAEKPDMKELDDMYINDKVLSKFGEDTSGVMTNIGKIILNASVSKEIGALSFAIGEYGGNTDLTYRSIIETVKYFKPDGYEEFLEKFTRLGEASADKYTVTYDGKAYSEAHEIEASDGYKYVYVTFGE